MEKYFKRKSIAEISQFYSGVNDHENQPFSKKNCFEVGLENLSFDPGFRPRITFYHPNVRDQVRLRYLQKGPCQPLNHKFPKSKSGDHEWSFQRSWFDKYPYWLEYSVENDAAYCLCCYLFKPDKGEQSGGDSFVLDGFRNWKRLEKFKYHIGGPNSYHNQAVKNCQALMNQKQHSPRRRDILNEKQALKVKKAIESGELSIGQVLEDLTENSDNRVEASDLVDYMTSFDFAFNLHMMKNILGITFELSQALQRKDQDIINAMSLVHLSKRRLLLIRNNGWDNLLDEVSHFCIAHNIDMPNMQEKFVARGRSQRNVQEMTNLFHYRVELFYAIIDLQLSEHNSRFNEGNTKLLICMTSLNPSDCFQAFDKGKLVRFAQFYLLEFSSTDLMALELQLQLDNYIDDMRSNSDCSKLNDITSLAQKMVEKKKHLIYSLVYLLITLALTLPVATASVERAFSAMKIMKTHLRNRMGDQFLNDSLIPYVEKDIFDSVDKEMVMQRFLNMKPCRGQ
ncbi:52 kDa repressor of the inhibitor of the protein kinase-like [Pistacia vera]|uniref:52 kDa repressor of the inhibitor of the protein kinase-like n=1 Tax=Pistacia vera TaxID=55513 RepID=UPI001262FE76|nr:52 kDa repressor of the inhibitor of the protein kinase-like [Pistacia vera]